MNISEHSETHSEFQSLIAAKRAAFRERLLAYCFGGVFFMLPFSLCILVPLGYLVRNPDTGGSPWAVLPLCGIALFGWVFFDWLLFHQRVLWLAQKSWRNRLLVSRSAQDTHYGVYLRDHAGDYLPQYVDPVSVVTGYGSDFGWVANPEGYRASRSRLKKLIPRDLSVFTLWRSGTSIRFNPVFAANQEWESDIGFIIDHASVIFMDIDLKAYPEAQKGGSLGQGLQFECRYLSESGQLKKTVLLIDRSMESHFLPVFEIESTQFGWIVDSADEYFQFPQSLVEFMRGTQSECDAKP